KQRVLQRATFDTRAGGWVRRPLGSAFHAQRAQPVARRRGLPKAVGERAWARLGRSSTAERFPEPVDELGAPIARREGQGLVVQDRDIGSPESIGCRRVDLAVADYDAALGSDRGQIRDQPRYSFADRAQPS
ncbi:MAG: hypothetical protein LC749_08005, partial [Actinobacteria bacterium]|nr:hypothetical protein [Actinomycetota bacterium]